LPDYLRDTNSDYIERNPLPVTNLSDPHPSRKSSLISESSSTSRPSEAPPQLPPHLEKVLLNSSITSKDDASILPIPSHVILNHLYACSIREGVMAVACTSRYRKKVRFRYL